MFQFLIQNSWAGYHTKKSQLIELMLMVRAKETMYKERDKDKGKFMESPVKIIEGNFQS